MTIYNCNFFLTLNSVIYTNLTVKPRGGHPFVPSVLFATNDDILVFQNELNVIGNHLAEQTQLFLSELDNGNINLANKLAKDHNLNLQNIFKLNSALVKMHEVKLKQVINVPMFLNVLQLQTHNSCKLGKIPYYLYNDYLGIKSFPN